MISADLQPDQRPDLWDDHVCVYEAVFEPFTAEFASQAIARLQLHSHDRVLDADRIAFAPGMAAVVVGLGERRTSALDAFVRALEARWGQGQVLLGGTAFIATAFVS